MKIIQGDFSFTILETDEELRSQFLKVERGARIAHQAEAKKSPGELVQLLLDLKHGTPFTFGTCSVIFHNPSRGFTHEFVRHQEGITFCQESTRWIKYDEKGGCTYIAPNHQDIDTLFTLPDGSQKTFRQMLQENENNYFALKNAGWKNDDARAILATALKAEILAVANFREWHHIFELRLEKVAHWEIRATLGQLVEVFKTKIPVIFDDFVVAGKCEKGYPFYRYTYRV